MSIGLTFDEFVNVKLRPNNEDMPKHRSADLEKSKKHVRLIVRRGDQFTDVPFFRTRNERTCNAFRPSGMLCNNTAYILPSDDPWIMATVNAPVSWWYAWRNAIHGKDEALRFIKDFVHDFPIPTPTQEQRDAAATNVGRLVETAHTQQTTRRQLLDWLRVEHEVAKPTLKLKALLDLDCDAFVAEVRKVRGRSRPLTSAALANLRDEHARSIAPMRALATEALRLEHHLGDLINAAYHLTPEEIALLWQTAPPRMPIGGPGK